MTRLLRNKRDATRFQVLIEIASAQPVVHLKPIADKLGVSVQAVSSHIHSMRDIGWLSPGTEGNPRVTREGVIWLMENIREMKAYLSRIETLARNTSVSAAIAGVDLSAGQTVGLRMDHGRLIADVFRGHTARGIAVTDAQTGTDVGISSIEGIVDLIKGTVAILVIPTVQHGGSQGITSTLVENEIRADFVGAIGIEAAVYLKKSGIRSFSVYGVHQAVINAAECGLSALVACVSSEVNLLVQSLGNHHISYKVLNAPETR